MPILRSLVLAAFCLTVWACKKESTPAQPDPPPSAPAAVMDAAPVAEPWRMQGQLLGTVGDRAVVLADEIMSVDIDTGERRTASATAAEDPAPSFDDFLPRLGESEREALAVDRLADMPVYVGGEVVVFMRGTEDAVTSVVGLDATTLEEAWAKELAYKRPLRTCATAEGIVLIPETGQPARSVDWLGGQRWLREFGDADEDVVDFACGDQAVLVVLKSSRAKRLRTFDAATGDLVENADVVPSAPLSEQIERAPAAEERVRQVGEEVVGPT